MSTTVSAATETAVSASISTPVRSVVRTVAVISTASSATVEVDGDAGDRERVAQRDQRRRLLGAHDPGEPGDGERVALGHAVAAQQLDDLGGDEHPPGGDGLARGDVLAGHVDHAGGAGLVDVGELGHRAPSGRLELLVEQQHGHCLPASTEVTASGTTISASASRQVADQVRAGGRRPG